MEYDEPKGRDNGGLGTWLLAVYGIGAFPHTLAKVRAVSYPRQPSAPLQAS